jgi:DNA-binding response OmpR family regulator
LQLQEKGTIFGMAHILARLLVVDDEVSTLQALKATLEPLRCDVLTLTDSERAAQYLEEQKFDGVILDVRIPPPDGFELTRRARASSLNSRTPIVLLAERDDLQALREGFKAGATCFLGKPVTRERINRLINALRGPILTEQRRHMRLPLVTKLECRWGEGKDKQMVAESLSIGGGGMSFKPAGTLAEGQEVTLEFTLPLADRPLHIRGKVLRQQSPEFAAVEFIGGAIRDREAIQNFITGRLQD